MDKKSPLPFGLQFEENPIDKEFVIPIYDENEDMSMVIDKHGQKIPFVEYCGNLGTKTATKVQNEGNDEDPDSMDGTRTITRVKEESSDSDEDRYFHFLGTRTDTFVQSEQIDTDPGFDNESEPSLNTKTATSVSKEGTDED